MGDVWKRIRKGAEQLTPLQLATSKRWGVIGQLVGLCIGMVWLFRLGFWYWIPFMFFTVVVLVVELIGVHKQVVALERFERGFTRYD